MDCLEIKNKICGVVIWYNPIPEMVDNIKSYINQIDKLYIFDNSETDNRILLDREDLKNYKIEYISFKKNLGIGKPLNIIAKKALNQNYEWLLTMDQDSYFENNSLKYTIDKLDKNSNIIIYAPNYKMNNKISKQNKNILLKITMTSGNLVDLKKLEKLNFYNEEFFIDEVDHEICYRALSQKMKILKIESTILNHKLGENSKIIKIKGNNHNAIRKYYIVRNKLYMIKKYNFLKIKYSIHILTLIVRVIFFENNRNEKLKMIKKAFKDYRLKLTGEIQR